MIVTVHIEQLLWVPELTSGTGNEISSAVYNLYNWCQLNKVEDMVFDITILKRDYVNREYVLLN